MTAQIERRSLHGRDPARGRVLAAVGALVLWALLVAVRLEGLGHYPAAHPDEGFWASGARNSALFGDALLDGRLHPFLSPVMFVLLRVYFAVVTPSLLSAREFSAVLGLLSCVLAWQIGRQSLRPRAWLFPLAFGLSSLAVTVERTILLESLEVFWLLVAATAWLKARRHAGILAGAALAVALLVKTNCIFCLPVFVGSWLASLMQGPAGRGRWGWAAWKELLALVATCGLIAGGGYLTAWAINPAGFVAAFRFELDGVHFGGVEMALHVGRFGFNPAVAGAMARSFAAAEPVLLVLAGLALVMICRRLRWANRADVFFGLWLVLGTLFHFMQIHISLHYLATLAPAYGYLAARLLNELLSGRLPLAGARVMGMVLVAAICVGQTARFGYGIAHSSEADYWQAVNYVGQVVPRNANVLAASYIDLSLPQRSYDLYRYLQLHEGSAAGRLDAVVDRYGISYLVVDPEWYAHDLDGAAAFLVRRCTRLATVGRFEVYAVRPEAGNHSVKRMLWLAGTGGQQSGRAMNILFLTSDYPNPYSPANGLFNEYLVRALSEEHAVRVVCPIPWTAELHAQWQGRRGEMRRRMAAQRNVAHPAYFYTPKVLRNHYGRFMWWSVRRDVRRVLAGFRPDVVLGYWAHPDGEVAVRVGREAGVASGVIIGGSDVLLLTRDRGRRRCVQAVLEGADMVITVNRHLREVVAEMGISPEKIHVWEQGVDPAFSPGDRRAARARLGLAPEGRAAVWVGRMVPVKALEVLLEACWALRQSGVEFALYLVGDGPLRKSLEARSAAAGLVGTVHFAGTQMHDRLPDWYRAADFTVLPSWSEGLPNVLRESLACGTPFVASRVGGIPEIAQDRPEWLAPPGDALALAAAMARMWSAPQTLPRGFRRPDWQAAARALARIVQSHRETRPLQVTSI